MLLNITQIYNKQTRDQYSDKKYGVDLLKSIIYKNEYKDTHIKLEMQSKIGGLPVSAGTVFRMVDDEFKSSMLHEANLQFNKSLYNWSAYKRLVSKGLWSWAYVTLYYAQFYAVTGLLNIQGSAFTRPLLEGKEHQLHIYPENFEDGIFIVESRRLNKPHQDVWNQFYKIYKNFNYKLPDYHELYEYDNENPFVPISLRNFTNYDITYDFPEYSFNEENLNAFIDKMSVDIFQSSFEDDNYLTIEYIASLRIKLLFEILNNVLDQESFIEKKHELNNMRKLMLDRTDDDTPVKRTFNKWVEN